MFDFKPMATLLRNEVEACYLISDMIYVIIFRNDGTVTCEVF